MSDYRLKLELRDYILSIREFINLSKVSKAVGISRQAITMFLMDEHHLGSISVSKLLELKSFIQSL